MTCLRLMKTSQIIMLTKNLLIIGAGSISKTHIKNIRLIDKDIKISCLSSSGRQISQIDLGVDQVFSQSNEIKNKKFDKVVICSPSSLHLTHTLPFLKKNIPILIEKPLSSDYKKALKFFEKNRLNINCNIGYNLRLNESLKFFRKAVDSNIVGDIHSIFSEVGQFLPNWRDKNYKDSVSARKDLGGGVLLELSHEIDYLTWIFGFPKRIFCFLNHSKELNLKVEDQAKIVFVNKDDSIVSLSLDMLKRNPKRTCRIEGKKGTLIWDFYKNEVTLQKPNKKKMILFKKRFNKNSSYLSEMKIFLSGKKKGLSELADQYEGLQVLKLIDALKMSHKKNKMLNF